MRIDAQTRPVGAGARPVTRTGPAAPSFAAVLQGQLTGDVRFSQHAQGRLEARDLRLDQGQLDRLNGALGSLAVKGGRTSLVLIDGLAMVVSVPGRTVITAVPASEGAVFTNIDSAIRA